MVKNIGFCWMVLLACAGLALAETDDLLPGDSPQKGVNETVTLKDGRNVRLKSDFTWDYLGGAPASEDSSEGIRTARQAVEVWDTTFDVSEVDYAKCVRLFIHYKNNCPKKVVGVGISVKVYNSFGSLIYEFVKNDEVVVRPMERMKNDSFFIWKDNQYINNEPYDKMWEAAQNGNAKITVEVRKVVFADGTVLTNEKKKK